MLTKARGVQVLVVVAVLLVPFGHAAAQLGDREPLEVARIFAAAYPATPSVAYIPGLAWSGAIQLTELTGEADWREKALREMQPFLEGDAPSLEPPYRLTALAGYMAFADLGSAGGGAGATGLAVEAATLMLPEDERSVVRSPTGWTDDMFMATSLLSRVAAYPGDDRLPRVIGRLLTTYIDRLQRPDGLFGHAEGGPYAWGRGNGFAALGMAEALARLPDDWPERPMVLEAFRAQMRALGSHQTDDGSWRQVVDRPESYRELTVTALTVSVMARGVRLGWLDEDEYAPVIERGWLAVLARIDEDGSVRDVCASTPAGTSLDFYLERPVVNGTDDRAGALVLLAALEMEELRRAR